jgi:ribosomal protein L35
MAAKVKKVKAKTHKATVKRFKLTANGQLRHIGQGGGNGHSNSYKSRRQKRNPKRVSALVSAKETRKMMRLVGK